MRTRPGLGKQIKRRELLLALLALCGASTARAQMYKWVDEKGVTHYTTSPPPAGQKSQELKVQTAPISSPPPPNASKNGMPSAPASSKGQRAAAPAASEGELIEGNWRNSDRERVTVRLSIRPSGDSVKIGQQWTVGMSSSVDTFSSYKIQGSGARGTLSAERDLGKSGVPPQMNYLLEADTLTISVASGTFTGTHRLKRSAE
jgi:hypothetical protein